MTLPSVKTTDSGFTLIELSIVLVIIGLIVGGVLVGRDLIIAAGVRAQISQIEKFHTAANTFKVKYGYLPGDIPNPHAANFGFATRGTGEGQGNGNGLLMGTPDDSGLYATGFLSQTGETAMFWVDLSRARLIDGYLSTATPSTTYYDNVSASTTPNTAAFYPAGKIGNANYVSVWSEDGVNYFALSLITSVEYHGVVMASTGLTARQAYNIDQKTDDGRPMTGRTLAKAPHTGGAPWAAQNFSANIWDPVPGDATTCFDNGNSVVNPWVYSIQTNGGSYMNCALSFRFQ